MTYGSGAAQAAPLSASAASWSALRRLMQDLTRRWRYKKRFKLFNRFRGSLV